MRVPEPPAGALPTETRHGAIRLIVDKCTSCMICVRECPTWCIDIEAHTESSTASRGGHPSRGRESQRAVLDAFSIDWTLCMYCGICIDECPFDALEWAGSHVPGAVGRASLVHGIAELEGET